MIELMDDEGTTLRAPIATAIRCGYDHKLSELWTATLELAAGDPLCTALDVPVSWVRLTDGDTPAGLYRLKGCVDERRETGATASYTMESAACTLLDDSLMGHHELGGTDYTTRQVIDYILAHQSTPRWVLGDCDFDDQYQYNFEDVTLLEALLSLGEVLVEPHAFVFDTERVPWTVHLRRLGNVPVRTMVYGRGVTGIRRTVDGRVVTRLYGRGSGEGDNQVTVAGVNGGLDYIEADEETMARYRVRTGTHVDLRQTDPETLLARMRAILEGGKRPQVSYEIDCVDYHLSTGEALDDAQVGDCVRVLDEELGAISVRVVERIKDDLEGAPGALRIRLESRARDTAEAIDEVLDKIGVQELYSQGATNLYSMQIADSADEDHPLEMSFYVPGNVLRINRCLLKWRMEAFRSYVRMAASGGGATRTSQSGGGGTVSTPTVVQSFGGNTGAPQASGEANNYTSSAGGHDHGTLSHDHSIGETRTGSASPRTTSVDGHRHTFYHIHEVTANIRIPSMDLELTPHTHDVTIPEHTHDLEYGIYTGSRAGSVRILVDGEEIPAEDIGEDKEIDVARYLRADANGRVTRGTWHKVAFVPDKLTRIVCNLFFQVFIQSRGAGDY